MWIGILGYTAQLYTEVLKKHFQKVYLSLGISRDYVNVLFSSKTIQGFHLQEEAVFIFGKPRPYQDWCIISWDEI